MPAGGVACAAGREKLSGIAAATPPVSALPPIRALRVFFTSAFIVGGPQHYPRRPAPPAARGAPGGAARRPLCATDGTAGWLAAIVAGATVGRVVALSAALLPSPSAAAMPAISAIGDAPSTRSLQDLTAAPLLKNAKKAIPRAHPFTLTRERAKCSTNLENRHLVSRSPPCSNRGMTDPEHTADRRPIASRNLAIFQKLAQALASSRVSANAISIAGMFAAAAAAAALVATSYVDGMAQRMLFLAAAGGIQLRLLANMLDGMVAIASNTTSPTGELYNEIPDRVSDTLILAAAGYAVGGVPALGWAAACMALFVTYIRAVGKTLGVPGLFHGPMSKSHRMFTLTVACAFLAIVPEGWRIGWSWKGWSGDILALTLGGIIAGTAVTATRRMMRIGRELNRR